MNASEATVMLNYFCCSWKEIFLKVVFNVKLLSYIILFFFSLKIEKVLLWLRNLFLLSSCVFLCRTNYKNVACMSC